MHIIVTGGYGYRNAGDEAQLASNLTRWRKHVPGCRFTVLSPDLDYTRTVHGQPDMEILPATRIVWFESDKRPYYFRDSERFRKKFRVISRWNRLLARLAVAGIPLTKICSKQNALLHETIRKSDVLFISGGGFLTGSTLSRLWDTMLLIQIAGIYGVPVLLSGQTLGGIASGDVESLNLVREALKIPPLVYTRDNDLSVKAAREWGIVDERLSAGFDDALFGPATGLDEVNDRIHGKLERNGYVALNAHYWGSTRKDSKTIINKIASLCDYINRKYSVKTVLVAMSPVDEEALADIEMCMETEASRFDFDYDPCLIRGVIRGAKIVVSMKHHPLVFSLGEGVPCLAVYSEPYYQHKNTGALGLFDMGRYSMDIARVTSAQLEHGIDELINNHAVIEATIRDRLEKYKIRDGEIIRRWLESRDKGLSGNEI